MLDHHLIIPELLIKYDTEYIFAGLWALLSIQLLQTKGYILNFLGFYSRVYSQAALKNQAFKIKAETEKNKTNTHKKTL